jgi:lipid-binding SYLF domain-containing protein
MIDVGEAHTDKFLNYSQVEGLRNMLGGARGIFIAPNTGGGALIAGVNTGTGFLMRRHGDAWSDPVFFDLTETSAGLQVGIKKSDVIVLLMTDTAVNNFVNGTMRVGGSGGITLGAYGMSISGAGGLNGGLELLIISATQGVSLGGGVASITPKLDAALNAQAYGSNADAKAILAGTGGKYAPARKLREDLTRMVCQAWDVQNESTTRSTADTRP